MAASGPPDPRGRLRAAHAGLRYVEPGRELQRPDQRHAVAGVPEGQQPDGPAGLRAHLVYQDCRAFDGAQCDGGGEGGILTGDAVVM